MRKESKYGNDSNIKEYKDGNKKKNTSQNSNKEGRRLTIIK